MNYDNQNQFSRLLTLLEKSQKRIEELEAFIKQQREEKLLNRQKINHLNKKLRFLEKKLVDMGISHPYRDFQDSKGHILNLSDAMMKKDNFLVVGEAVVEKGDIVITESTLSPVGEKWLENITKNIKGKSLREFQSSESFNNINQKAIWSFENRMTPTSHSYLFNFKGHKIPSVVRFIPISKKGEYKGYFFNKLYPDKRIL
ncbi:MAG: hypothetical protein PVI90_01375 [Desulfobacteraceae bacterium]